MIREKNTYTVTECLNEQQLCERVKSVSLLNTPDCLPYKNATVSIREFSFSEVLPTTRYVLQANLRSQRELSAILARQGYDPLSLKGALILVSNGGVFSLTPPIVENDKVFGDLLIDGAHRASVGKQAGRISFLGIHIVGANPDYPVNAYPNKWEDIFEYEQVPQDPKLKKDYRMPNYRDFYRNFGPLNGSAVRTR